MIKKLFYFFILIVFLCSSANAEIIRINASYDTIAYSFAPGTNYNNIPSLFTQSNPTLTANIYIKFILPPLPTNSSINSITMSLYNNYEYSIGNPQKVYLISSDWNSSNMTWNDKPTVTDLVNTTYMASGVNRYYNFSLPITSSIYGYMITVGNTLGFIEYNYNSIENATHQPYFEIEYSPQTINVQVLDERTYTTVATYTATLFADNYVISNSTTNGYANFSGILEQEYLLSIIPNSTYKSRSILTTSSNLNTSSTLVYIPNSDNSIVDTVSFYLLDYTGLYPLSNSYIVVSKNNSVMHSQFFDAASKTTINLIKGEPYQIAVRSGSNIRSWGNYMSAGSGSAEIVIMDTGINSSSLVPFQQYISSSDSNITLHWQNYGLTLYYLNYTIYKGTTESLVHVLNTTAGSGTSEYVVTNTSDIYYAYSKVLTNSGWRNTSKIVDYREGAENVANGRAWVWSYGSFTMPTWIYNAVSIILLLILGITFGTFYRGVGSILTGFLSLFLAYQGWLDETIASSGFVVGLLIFAILYHLESKRRAGI